MILTDLDRKAWDRYEAEAARAAEEYATRPAARPHIHGLYLCLCCDILTEHPSTICLACQSWSPEWAALAADPDALLEIRRANKRMSRRERRAALR